MSRFSSLLLPLDGSAESANAAGCALWLAEALGAALHVLHATDQPLPGREALARLRVSVAQRAQVVLHQVKTSPEEAVVEAIGRHCVDLVVMSARGHSAAAGVEPADHLGSVARVVLERVPVPVVLLPARYREALPWTSMLAAASGEAAADGALQAAVQLAAALRIQVTVVHAGDRSTSPGAAYADAPHHEYVGRLEEMVQRGLARCTGEEAGCVRRILLRRGDAAAVLLEQAAQERSSVLALGWQGAFGAGRALVLKRLLAQAPCALLLARRSGRPKSRLKVGEDIDG